jgi:hypothetical protein
LPVLCVEQGLFFGRHHAGGYGIPEIVGFDAFEPALAIGDAHGRRGAARLAGTLA